MEAVNVMIGDVIMEDAQICRICLDGVDTENPNNELFSPCLCKGTQQYIHVNCLDAWREQASRGNRNNMTTCPTCMFQYRTSRAWFHKVLTNQIFISIFTAVALISIVILVSYFFDLFYILIFGAAARKGIWWWSMLLTRWASLIAGIVVLIMMFCMAADGGGENAPRLDGLGGFLRFLFDLSYHFSNMMFVQVLGSIGIFTGIYNLVLLKFSQLLKSAGNRVLNVQRPHQD